jgi:hypothetical protein
MDGQCRTPEFQRIDRIETKKSIDDTHDHRNTAERDDDAA